MRLEVQLHQLGRTSQDMLGRKLWQLLLAACTEADGLQGQTLQARAGTWNPRTPPAYSSSSSNPD